MRQPEPYFKKSHKAWYVNVGGRQIRLAKDEKEAWEEYHKIMAGEVDIGRDPTLNDLFMAFTRWSERNHKPDTREFYKMYQSSFIATVGPGKRVSQVNPRHVTNWLDDNWPIYDILKGDKVIVPRAAASTRNGAVRAVKRPFNWGVSEGLIGRSPLVAVKTPKPTSRDTYLMPDQYDTLLAQVKHDDMRDVMETLRHTGCRPTELRLIEARWVNHDARCWEFPDDPDLPPKLQGRVVMLNDTAWQITERLCRENTDGPIFRSRIRNKPYSKAALVERFRKLRAHVDFHASPYTIRHTFATDAILQGVDLITIKELMGHEDLRMLEKIYQHVKKRGDHLRAGLEKATVHLNGAS
jgi:site-specific recombinase XerD